MFGWRKSAAKDGMETTTLKIDGMSCQGCVRHVTSALGSLPGVQVQHVDVGSATIQRGKEVTDEVLMKALADAGYSARKVDAS